MKKRVQRPWTSSVAWNIFLLTVGPVIFGIGVKAIAVPHNLITGGVSGSGLLLYYATGWLSPGLWYLLINLPIFIVGWIMISRRFFLYSMVGMMVVSVVMDSVSFVVPIHDTFLAVLAGGAMIGLGSGITLHSLGSLGGNDIIAVVLNQRFNVRMGTFFFGFNILLFALSIGVLEVDLVLYSLAMSFATSKVLDTVLTLFNQRKMVLIISSGAKRMAEEINIRLHRGATLISGTGSFTGKPKTIIMTVVHNYQLKRLEELVLSRDGDAFMITENTFNVLGKGFSKRRQY